MHENEVPGDVVQRDDKSARDMVVALMDHGMTATEISEALDKRVSHRTVYRWAKGETSPQQESDLRALADLHGTKLRTVA